MKNKLMRYAMLYVAEMMEDYNDASAKVGGGEYTDLAYFMEDRNIDIKIKTWNAGGHRVDMKAIITERGEVEAQFEMNVAR